MRFVRNRMGYHEDGADFIEPQADAGASADAGVTAWTWKPLPEPALAPLPPRGRAWERARYRAYQDWLAGHTIGEAFERAERSSRWHPPQPGPAAAAHAAPGPLTARSRDPYRPARPGAIAPPTLR